MRGWPFVGRSTELARLLALCEDDEVHAVVLVGAAGVGKTRLAREVGRSLADHGRPVLWALATQATAGLPLAALESVMDGPAQQPAGARILHAAAQLHDATGRPLLVVDDAHLLDPSSAAVLQQAAMAGTIDVLATVRAGEPTSDTIRSLWKEDWGERVDIEALERPGLAALLEVVLGGPVDELAELRLWEESAGNALYLRELLHGALATGALVERDGRWRLTGRLPRLPRLLELVALRLDGVDETQAEVLDRLAIAGALAVGYLRDLRGPAVVALLEREGLLEVRTDGRRTEARLAHPLYGEVLLDRMPADRVRALKLELAGALLAFGRRRAPDLLRQVVWTLEGGGEMNAEHLLMAAMRATNMDDMVLSDRLALAARQAGAGVFAAVILAVNALERGEWQAADDLLAPLADEVETEEEIFRVAHARAWALLKLGRPDDATALLEDASERVSDPRGRAALRAEAADVRLELHDEVGGLALLEEELADPDEPQYFRPATVAAVAAANLGLVGRVIEIVEHGRASYSRAGAVGVPPEVLDEPMAMALLEAGRLDEADELITAAHLVFVAAEIPERRSIMLRLRGDLEVLRGRLDRATEAYAEAIVQAEFGSSHPARVVARGALALALGQAARGDEAAAALAPLGPDPLADGTGGIHLWRGVAWRQAADGDLRAATETLDRGVAAASGRHRTTAEAMLRHDLLRLGVVSDAVRLRALAEALDPLAAFAHVQVAHGVAVVGDDGPALDAVAADFAAIGCHLLAAEAAAHAAEAHRRAGQRRAAAASDRAEAAWRARGAGGPPLLRTTHGPVRLSRREREVAELAARGLTSRVIGERLFLSTRTVENHLQRVYTKLGVTSRDELAAALLPEG